MRTTALILAGGQSRRMGRDKLLLPRRPGSPETVLEHVVKVAFMAADRVLVLGQPSGAITRLLGAEFLADPAHYRGPLYALSHGWKHPSVADSDAVLVLAGDLPGLAADVVLALTRELLVNPNADGAAVVREGEVQPLLAIYRNYVGKAFAQAVEQGETRLLKVVNKLRLVRVDAEQMGWPMWWTRPIHTPADYQDWLLETEDER